jgi:phosphoribosyl-AMP cyclohydrolase
MSEKQQNQSIDQSTEFTPKYDKNGLIPCIVTSSRDGEVLMMAYMNDAALAKTLETGEAHYWSRSRNELWHKGATSGQVQKIVEILTDCDQDTLLIKVKMPEPVKACHTGRKSCFYRVVKNGKLEFKTSTAKERD